MGGGLAEIPCLQRNHIHGSLLRSHGAWYFADYVIRCVESAFLQ